MNSIIEVKNVTYEYSDEDNTFAAVKNLSLNIERGSFTVILGHNGSGKSTLAKMLNGLNKPTSGDVFVDGLNTKDEKTEIEVKRKVGMVFQNPDNQIIASIVEEDVAFGPENLGLPPAEIRKRVDDALATVGMSAYSRHEPHRLSGGQKQRVAIAGVIAMLPECIIFDESTAMLDPVGRRDVLTEIDKLNKQNGITIITITHYMNEAALADKVIVLDNGHVAAEGTPSEIFAERDLLNKCGLDVPQCTAVALGLEAHGYKIDGDITTVDKCADAIAGFLERNGVACVKK